MDEPTLGELLRDLQADVHTLLNRQQDYVTKEILELRLQAVTKEQTEQKARLDALKNWVWSAVAGPVIVGFILYLLIGKTP